jgi:hypothetical protein
MAEHFFLQLGREFANQECMFDADLSGGKRFGDGWNQFQEAKALGDVGRGLACPGRELLHQQVPPGLYELLLFKNALARTIFDLLGLAFFLPKSSNR